MCDLWLHFINLPLCWPTSFFPSYFVAPQPAVVGSNSTTCVPDTQPRSIHHCHQCPVVNILRRFRKILSKDKGGTCSQVVFGVCGKLCVPKLPVMKVREKKKIVMQCESVQCGAYRNIMQDLRRYLMNPITFWDIRLTSNSQGQILAWSINLSVCVGGECVALYFHLPV